VSACLRKPSVLQRIEGELQCNGLFDCRSEADLDALMNSVEAGLATATGSESDCLMTPPLLSEEEFALHGREDKVVKNLLGPVTHGLANIVCWPDPPAAGSSFIAYILAGALRKEGVTAYLLRPYPDAARSYLEQHSETFKSRPFAHGLQQLSRELGLGSRASAERVNDFETPGSNSLTNQLGQFRIPAHRGQGFQSNVDTDSSRTWTELWRDRGQDWCWPESRSRCRAGMVNVNGVTTME